MKKKIPTCVVPRDAVVIKHHIIVVQTRIVLTELHYVDKGAYVDEVDEADEADEVDEEHSKYFTLLLKRPEGIQGLRG